ncbi:hypothetical protein E3983_02325 [Legionella israelensis]|uniref:Uncharacterized protein n=1 Tax=Legionella israelensis TaxID=454 RepID=A0AAX1EJF7_9GAMM|nr:hypothetical protein E3983_02325 [Legionella israelensis]QBS11076.1 hypothetical protein E4T55_05335 [Legionella israelensis]QDP73577.1 hypothetical protein FOG18_04175 [Legionella israelensis]
MAGVAAGLLFIVGIIAILSRLGIDRSDSKR